MTKSKVRCWLIENWRGKDRPDKIYITYPEDNSGYDLISCLQCGHIYAVSVVRQVYIGPAIDLKLGECRCVQCDAKLRETFAPYPEQYLSNGEVVNFQRPVEIPSDIDSIVAEFDEIYD